MPDLDRLKVILLIALSFGFLAIGVPRLYFHLEERAQAMGCGTILEKPDLTIHAISATYRRQREECERERQARNERLEEQRQRQEERDRQGRIRQAEIRVERQRAEERCTADLERRLQAAIAENRFRESTVAFYFDLRAGEVPLGCVHVKPYDRPLETVRLGVPIPGGIVLLGRDDYQRGDSVFDYPDRVWHQDTVYSVWVQNDWLCLSPQCQGRTVRPSAELLSSYEAVARLGEDSLASLATDRAVGFFDRRDHGAAREVASYALRLDPAFTRARYTAAASAARQDRVVDAVGHLSAIELPPRELVERVQADSSFRPLLSSDGHFRYNFYEDWVEPARSSEFLGQFELALDQSKTEVCEEYERCEGIKRYAADLVLKSRNSDWSMVLERDLQDHVDAKVDINYRTWLLSKSAFLVEIERRLFYAALGQAYEVDYEQKELVPLGAADRIAETDGGFPLVLSQHRPGAGEHWRWTVSTYSGETGASIETRGDYGLERDSAGSLPSLLTAGELDPYWIITSGTGKFVLVDLITGDRYPLREVES